MAVRGCIGRPARGREGIPRGAGAPSAPRGPAGGLPAGFRREEVIRAHKEAASAVLKSA